MSSQAMCDSRVTTIPLQQLVLFSTLKQTERPLTGTALFTTPRRVRDESVVFLLSEIGLDNLYQAYQAGPGDFITGPSSALCQPESVEGSGSGSAGRISCRLGLTTEE